MLDESIFDACLGSPSLDEIIYLINLQTGQIPDASSFACLCASNPPVTCSQSTPASTTNRHSLLTPLTPPMDNEDYWSIDAILADNQVSQSAQNSPAIAQFKPIHRPPTRHFPSRRLVAHLLTLKSILIPTYIPCLTTSPETPLYVQLRCPRAGLPRWLR